MSPSCTLNWFPDVKSPVIDRRYRNGAAPVAAPCERRPFFKFLSAVADRHYNLSMHSDERPPRLKRLDQIFTSHPLYFITTCTEDRKPLLANSQVHDDFQRFCRIGLERGVFVGKYVLMPDHLHLFVAFGDEYESALIKHHPQNDTARDSAVAAVCDRRLFTLSQWMKSLKNTLSRTLRGMNIPAPHWQKGFFDHLMRSEESYSEKWLYVAENPIRKLLVTRLADWPYQGEIYPLGARGHIL